MAINRVSHNAAAVPVLTTLCLAIVVCISCLGSVAADDKPAADAATKFDRVGPQAGEQIPDVPLRTLNDEPMSLHTVCDSMPTLIVTSSFTCPKSRSRWPELEGLAKKYSGKLNVVIVYVIEAHPIDDICPYKGVEDVTAENRREKILRRQPKTLEARIELAREFRGLLGIEVPIYVDTMKNTGWTALGGAPNLGLLVAAGGKVVHRQGWFGAEELQPVIEKFLASLPERGKRPAKEDGKNPIEAKLKSAGIHRFELRRIFQNRDTAKAKELLDKIPELATYIPPYEGRDQSGGRSLLVEAAETGTIEQIELLLARGADINSQTQEWSSALHMAAREGQLEAVALLIRHGAQVNLNDLRNGFAPLHCALYGNHRDVAELLIKAGAKEDFFSHCAMGKLEEVRRVMDVDPARAFIPKGRSGTPLAFAVANDQVAVLALLIEHGALVVGDDLEMASDPIHLAAKQGHVRATRALLKAGASPNAQSYPEGTPLHVAIRTGHVQVAKTLIDAGADLTIRNMYSQTPLHHAAMFGQTEIVSAILAAGADANPLTEAHQVPCGPPGGIPASYDTPLHLAAQSMNAETVAALIGGGAKIDAENASGATPLALALAEPQWTDPDRTKKEAARRLQTIRVLLAAGASRGQFGKRGDSIRAVLEKIDDPEIRRLLKR